MNTLEKQAVLNKLASMQQAICYVLRQRLMSKQAEGGIIPTTFDYRYWDNNIRPRNKSGDIWGAEFPYKKRGPYSPEIPFKQLRQTDTPAGPNSFGGLTNSMMESRYQNAPVGKFNSRNSNLNADLIDYGKYQNRTPGRLGGDRYNNYKDLQFSPEYSTPTRRYEFSFPVQVPTQSQVQQHPVQ